MKKGISLGIIGAGSERLAAKLTNNVNNCVNNSSHGIVNVKK